MQHNSLYTLSKEWFGDSVWKIKQGLLKKTKLNLSVIVVSKNLTSFVINKFLAWQSGYAWNIFASYHMKWVSRDPQKETIN